MNDAIGILGLALGFVAAFVIAAAWMGSRSFGGEPGGPAAAWSRTPEGGGVTLGGVQGG
jgi:uncharacterized membrane protein